MVRYYCIHSRRARRNVREVMEKLGKLVKHIIKPFSWRKNVQKYEGEDPLKCSRCGGQMKLYKIIYRNKYGEIIEYGDIDRFIKKITRRNGINEKEEKEKKETMINKIKEAEYRSKSNAVIIWTT